MDPPPPPSEWLDWELILSHLAQKLDVLPPHHKVLRLVWSYDCRVVEVLLYIQRYWISNYIANYAFSSSVLPSTVSRLFSLIRNPNYFFFSFLRLKWIPLQLSSLVSTETISVLSIDNFCDRLTPPLPYMANVHVYIYI